jgi:carboxypeptidase D
MNSVFTEAGPLRCYWNDPKDLDSFVVNYRPELSWQSLGDLLFVDHPVGTGWSYGDHSPESLPEVAADFVTFLNNFYDEYPERRVQELVLTGESFAGKYLSFTG